VSLTGNEDYITISLYDIAGDGLGAPAFINGAVPQNATGAIDDPNGNELAALVNGGTITFEDTLTDQVDQRNTVMTVSGTNPVNYQYTGPNSTAETVAVNYGTYNIQTHFGCSSVKEYSASNVSLISSIGMPDGTSYSFTYELNGSYYTGRVAKIGLPTGSTISYQYTGGSSGIDCADGTAAGLKRTTPDGSWTYTRSNTTGVTYAGQGITTTILDPSSNKTVYTFSDGYQTQRQVSSSSGTPLDTLVTCYNGNYASCASTSTAISGAIKQQDGYHTPGGVNAQTSLSETFYNAVGLTTQDNEFGYGINTGAAPTGTPIKAILSSYSPTLGTAIK